jgi:hypothetical protein
MDDKNNESSTDITLQNDGPFHIALAWLAALSVSICCVGVPFLMVL